MTKTKRSSTYGSFRRYLSKTLQILRLVLLVIKLVKQLFDLFF